MIADTFVLEVAPAPIAILTVEDALDLRAFAEQYADPNLYEMAARYFDALDMPASAMRCRDRANYYRMIA